MHTTALPGFSPIGATAFSGDFIPSGQSTNTSVFSFSITSSEDIFQDNIALLVTPQECKIHAIFGSRLAPAGICGVTKNPALSRAEGSKEDEGQVSQGLKFCHCSS